MKNILAVIPQKEELEPLVRGLQNHGFETKEVKLGSLSGITAPSLGLTVALGGNGKAQFAAQTQYLIDRVPGSELVLCAGAAGALDQSLGIGDLVVATHTIEHDYRDRFNQQPLPRFPGDPFALEELRRVSSEAACAACFGPVASGDEDIVNPTRAAELRAQTGALCVAWEGSGGARAAAFNQIPFLEIRAITDTADHDAASNFARNLATSMPNLAKLLIAWLRRKP